MRTVRRFLLRELDSAIAKLEKGPPSDHAVHEIRKELKRVRAILRLLRPCLGVRAYRRENAVVRDAARPLTPLRDAAILPQALRQLQARTRRKNDGAFMRYLLGVLRQEHRAAHRQLQGRDLKTAVRELRAFKRRIEALPASRLDRATPSNGLIRTYKSGRSALASVTLQATDEHLHEWRKQVTYLANQLECIAPPDSQGFAARLDRFRRLARHLGDDHDLAVFNRKILQNDGAEDLESRVARRREALQSKAFRLGQRLYARRPRRLASAWASILPA
ncbi:MAG: CHAD domain-containing protein [Steroidobacteraceae bacterium]